MQLIYKIEYVNSHGYFKHIINECINRFGIEATCEQYEGFLLIIFQEEEEKVEGFFQFLQEALPLSLFIKSAYFIESWDKNIAPVCQNESHANIAINSSMIIDIYKNSHAFLTEVDTLLQGGILRFKNSNGYKNLSLPHAQSALKFRDNLRVLIINLNAISELFMINDKEVQLLSCIERPLVKLQFKASQNSQKEFGNQRIVLAKLPEDENTYKLATSLRKHNVDFLIYEDEAIQEDLQVSYYEHNNIIIKGDRCVFPIKDDTTNEIYQNSAQYYAYKGSVFQGVLSLEKPNIDTCIGVYLSFKHKSSFCVYTAEHGYKEIITIQTLPCDMTQCLTEISSMDENVTRLFENYTKKFPSILRKEHPLLEGSSLNKLLDLLVYILDFQNKTAFEEAALMCTSKSGMSLDFNVIKVEGKNRLDYRKIAQSMMSYKLAGVPHTLLAYSFYESLAASIGENVTKINTEIKTSKVLLCGDFFANSIVLSKCYKNLTKYDVTVPQSLPLDY